jgi:hypothetical protein
VITAHLGVAAAARATVRTPLEPFHFFLLMGASVSPDVLDVLYWAASVCSPYGLYSHTLPAVVLQAAVIGGVALLVSGSRAVALLFAAVVMLHVPGDLVTGQKLLMPGGEMVGLNVYDSALLDWIIEVPILAAGWWILRRSGRGTRWATTIAALVLMVLVQTQFDVLSQIRGRGVKPNACPKATPGVPGALVPSAG